MTAPYLAIGLSAPLAILALDRIARAVRRWWCAYFDDALTDNTRTHKIAVAILYPTLLATALRLTITDSIRTRRSSR